MWVVPIDVVYPSISGEVRRTDYAVFNEVEKATQFVRDMQELYPNFTVYAPESAVDAEEIIARARSLS